MRQFDVVFRGKLGGGELLGVIECKDLSRRVGTPEVDAFHTKYQDVNANIAILASRRGFTKPALEEARHYGIGAVSLLPDDPHECGFAIGSFWYAEVFSWSRAGMTLHPKGKSRIPKDFDPTAVTYRNRRVFDWWLKQLVTTQAKRMATGSISCEVRFDRSRTLRIGGAAHAVVGITFVAERTRAVKRKFVPVFGNCVFDWHRSQIKIPGHTSVTSEAIRTDLADWEDADDPIPPPSALLESRLTAFATHFDPEAAVLDVAAL